LLITHHFILLTFRTRILVDVRIGFRGCFIKGILCSITFRIITLFNGSFLMIVMGIMRRARSFLLTGITFTSGLLKSLIFAILLSTPGLDRSCSAPSLIARLLNTPSLDYSYYPFTYPEYQQFPRSIHYQRVQFDILFYSTEAER
jgi:hypothetical protein